MGLVTEACSKAQRDSVVGKAMEEWEEWSFTEDSLRKRRRLGASLSWDLEWMTLLSSTVV